MARLIDGRGPIPPPVPPPDPEPIPTPTPTGVEGIKLPTGAIVTKSPITGKPYGTPWSDIGRWEPSFTNWATHYGIDPMYLPLIVVIESQGKHYTTNKMTGTRSQVVTRNDGFGDGLSVGMTQIKPKLWGFMAPTADPYTPDGNIHLASAFLADRLDARGQKIEEVIRRDYFPSNDPNGTTQNEYIDTFRALMAEVKPTPIPGIPPADPLATMFRGKQGIITYGFGSPGAGPWYSYGANHGLNASGTQHTGDDVPLPYGSPIYAPLSGRVTCVGDAGTPTWGQSCGAYNDTGDAPPGSAKKGVGNITLNTDAGIKIVFGHCRTSNFRPGDRVMAGQQIGTSGGQNGPHCHLEVAVDAPSKVPPGDRARGVTYWLVNPLPAIKAAMGATEPGPIIVLPITDIIWEGTANFHDRGGQEPVAITYHLTDDLSFENVKSWFQNPRSRASSHFVIDRDGSKHQFVGSSKASWSNGIINRPRTDIQWLNEAVRQVNLGRRNMNDYTINLEFINKPGMPFTREQIESGIDIVRYYVAIYPGIRPTRGHHVRHSDIDSVNRPYDPGPLFPLADLMRAVNADPLLLNP